MAGINELERLEGFVSKLISGYKNLKGENARLAEELSNKQQLIDHLRQELAAAEEKHSEVDGRIDELVKKVEGWEVELVGSEEIEEEHTESEKDSSGKQTTLFQNRQDGDFENNPES